MAVGEAVSRTVAAGVVGFRAPNALLKPSWGFGEEREVVGEDAQDELAALRRGVTGGQR